MKDISSIPLSIAPLKPLEAAPTAHEIGAVVILTAEERVSLARADAEYERLRVELGDEALRHEFTKADILRRVGLTNLPRMTLAQAKGMDPNETWQLFDTPEGSKYVRIK